MSTRQQVRQQTRDDQGRYDAYPKCQGCGKTTDKQDYASHPMTDCIGDDGVNWADTAIVLCDGCYSRTDHMRKVSEFVRFKETGWF